VGSRMEVDYGKGPAASQKAKQDSKERRKPKHRRMGSGGRDSSKDITSNVRVAFDCPLGQCSNPRDFRCPLPRIAAASLYYGGLRQGVRRRAGPLGPGNELYEGWNQPVVLETPGLEPPVSNKYYCNEWDDLVPEFIADFERVRKLDGGRIWSWLARPRQSVQRAR
jgi:hypothetical protein